MSSSPDIRVARVYDGGSPDLAGHRVLVDRLWPRGIARADAMWDEWCKDVAPTADLRQWYRHDTRKFHEFARRYRAELREPPASAAFDQILELARTMTITLLTATRDVDHSGARVLQSALRIAAAR